jgi:hypothetical protein
VWLVEAVANGHVVRARIQKGSLRMTQRLTAAGQMLTILDEDWRPVKVGLAAASSALEMDRLLCQTAALADPAIRVCASAGKPPEVLQQPLLLRCSCYVCMLQGV